LVPSLDSLATCSGTVDEGVNEIRSSPETSDA
jgi:hypothetical protein